jgi:hypothetical protein
MLYKSIARVLCAILLWMAVWPALAAGQEKTPPIVTITAQHQKAKEQKWEIIIASKDDSNQARTISDLYLDSLVGTTLYLSNGFWAAQTIPLSAVKMISYVPSKSVLTPVLIGSLAGGIPLGIAWHINNSGSRYYNGFRESLGIALGGAALGAFIGLLIGILINDSNCEVYNFSTNTTDEKALIIADLLLTGTTSRR